jgi:1,4-alpha-glucan branching enzyme
MELILDMAKKTEKNKVVKKNINIDTGKGSSLLTDNDLYLFNEGSHYRLYEKLGAHPYSPGRDREGYCFAVWAPDAVKVSVVGDFNSWDKDSHPMHPRGSSGIWETFIPGIKKNSIYKYHIKSRYRGHVQDKADPFAFFSERPPRTGSVTWDLDYSWKDREWMDERGQRNSPGSPISIYEIHIGSWMRKTGEEGRRLTYREMAPLLAKYLKSAGFTHVEFMPVMEHPFYGSWGYQVTGYFSPTARYGTPQDLMFMIDTLHQNGIGIILDWVPSHFPSDAHGLAFFDGTHLYEHSDPKRGIHPDWGSYIFNYGRNEVKSFLISNALFWLDRYHADGFRMDAVASMIYLDYSRKKGQWVPNRYGGNENLEALEFLRKLNQAVYSSYPDVQTIAEESTAWPMVSKPTYIGGLGFGMKWDMGWMHDTLTYMTHDPVHRKYHHDTITFRMIYAFDENFILPLSHDEVVHGKASLLSKMPGDDWQKFANLRLLLGYMYTQPGKKMLFMGGEFGQWDEWDHEKSLDWHLLRYEPHNGLKRFVTDLNGIYRREPSLHRLDFSAEGFEWIDGSDSLNSVLSYLRRSGNGKDLAAVICNFTPVTRYGYRIGLPLGGYWTEILNSDATHYGGSGQGNMGRIKAEPEMSHGRPFSAAITLPPLSVTVFRKERKKQEEPGEKARRNKYD